MVSCPKSLTFGAPVRAEIWKKWRCKCFLVFSFYHALQNIYFSTKVSFPQNKNPENVKTYRKARNTSKNKRRKKISAELVERAVKRARTVAKPTTQSNFEEKLFNFITTTAVPFDIVESVKFTDLFKGKVNPIPIRRNNQFNWLVTVVKNHRMWSLLVPYTFMNVFNWIYLFYESENIYV